MDEAKMLANRKFGFEKKEGLLLLCYFYHSNNYNHFEGYDRRKYKESKSIDVFSLAQNPNECEALEKKLIKKYKEMGWGIKREYWYD